MEYRIIRGSNQIGGTITEIYTEKTKIWVDFGAELSVKPEESTDQIMINNLKTDTPKAIIFTHIHGDHIGLLYEIPDCVDIYMGKLAKEMLINIRETLVKISALEVGEKNKLETELKILKSYQVKLYEDKAPQQIGDIIFTPFRVDHSVPDAYMLRFDADKRSIVHTGDFRNHGRLGQNLIEDIKSGIAKDPVDVLIIEGTMMSRKDEKCMTDLEREWHDRFYHLHTSGHATPGTIAKVIKAINPKERIVPVHTENPMGFLELKIPKEMKRKIKIDDEFIPSRFAAIDDCRALNQNGELWKALNGGALTPIVNMVRDNEDLELCFRGNSGSESVTVYFNNNEFLRFQIKDGSIKKIYNKDHSRYLEDREQITKKLDKLLDMFTDFDEIYQTQKLIMESYFNEELTKDYIKDSNGIIGSRKKDCKYEKQEQQKLMHANSNRQNGYYIYDMEYAQAFASEAVKIIYEKRTKGERHNKPDSLAIRYVDGKPVALVFVELKTTYSAMQGKSSAVNHIKGMRNFIEWDAKENRGEFLRNRKKEARKVMEEYQLLGLHNCGERSIEEFDDLDVEILLVITDNERPNMPKEKTAKHFYDTHKEDIHDAAIDNKCGVVLLKPDEFELKYEDVQFS